MPNVLNDTQAAATTAIPGRGTCGGDGDNCVFIDGSVQGA